MGVRVGENEFVVNGDISLSAQQVWICYDHLDGSDRSTTIRDMSLCHASSTSKAALCRAGVSQD